MHRYSYEPQPRSLQQQKMHTISEGRCQHRILLQTKRNAGLASKLRVFPRKRSKGNEHNLTFTFMFNISNFLETGKVSTEKWSSIFELIENDVFGKLK